MDGWPAGNPRTGIHAPPRSLVRGLASIDAWEMALRSSHWIVDFPISKILEEMRMQNRKKPGRDPGIALACRVAITCTLDDLGMGWMLEALLIVARIKLCSQGPGQTINNSREGSFQYHDIH